MQSFSLEFLKRFSCESMKLNSSQDSFCAIVNRLFTFTTGEFKKKFRETNEMLIKLCAPRKLRRIAGKNGSCMSFYLKHKVLISRNWYMMNSRKYAIVNDVKAFPQWFEFFFMHNNHNCAVNSTPQFNLTQPANKCLSIRYLCTKNDYFPQPKHLFLSKSFRRKNLNSMSLKFHISSQSYFSYHIA